MTIDVLRLNITPTKNQQLEGFYFFYIEEYKKALYSINLIDSLLCFNLFYFTFSIKIQRNFISLLFFRQMIKLGFFAPILGIIKIMSLYYFVNWTDVLIIIGGVFLFSFLFLNY